MLPLAEMTPEQKLALRELPPVPRRLFGYDSAPTQRYAFRALAGTMPAKGVFPFPSFL